MRIGYPCINRSIGCTPSHTFRLASFSRERLLATIKENLSCLERILTYNIREKLLFLRIGSGIVPFASHPVCTVSWQKIFKHRFAAIGAIIRHSGMRISMHPDQFVLINAPNTEIVGRSIRELLYHAEVLDALGLDSSAKIQIHTGGKYDDKEKSMARFISVCRSLDQGLRKRLVVENDDRLYSVADCLRIARAAAIPVLFDSFHHALNNNGETTAEAFRLCAQTWKRRDGIPMVDYSSQQKGGRRGAHAETIDGKNFRRFLPETAGYDFDLMLEIKDKEKSAIAARDIAVRMRSRC